METTRLFVFLVCLIRLSSQSQYRAVVVEYHPGATTAENIEKYSYMMDYAEGWNKTNDLIVFPEGSLSLKVEEASLVPHPDEKVIPYRNNTYSAYPPIRKMSEEAARRKVYLVVNLFERFECGNKTGDCPPRGYFIYNTNVAFDRNGAVIARYRKYNLYEKNVDKPKKAELSTFTTDFNVTFGMFTCFDILFKSPAMDLVQQKNIRHIIFPTWWFGELPFLTAVQMQAGWAHAMDVTLYAAGVNRPSQGSTGSGFYRRGFKFSEMVESELNIVMAAQFSKVAAVGPAKQGRGLKLKEDPSVKLATGKDLDLSAGKFSENLCYNELCCHFNIKYRRSDADDDGNYTYRAVAFSDARNFGHGEFHREAYCGVVLCSNGNCAKKPTSGNYPIIFDAITIDAVFRKENTFHMPSTLLWTGDDSGMMLLDSFGHGTFSFERQPTNDARLVNVSMRLTEGGVGNLITFAMYGREFD